MYSINTGSDAASFPLTGRPRPKCDPVCPFELEAPWEEADISFLLAAELDIEDSRKV